MLAMPSQASERVTVLPSAPWYTVPARRSWPSALATLTRTRHCVSS